MSDEELRRLRRIAMLDPSTENLARLGAAYLRHSTQTHSVKLIGRRWFQRGPGNTYHVVDVYVDGELVGQSGMEYGYGDHYIETGLTMLENLRPDIPPRLEHPNGSKEPPRLWAERVGIDFQYSVFDVARRREL